MGNKYKNFKYRIRNIKWIIILKCILLSKISLAKQIHYSEYVVQGLSVWYTLIEILVWSVYRHGKKVRFIHKMLW